MTAEATTQVGGRTLRVAALFSHPIQYFAPLMRTLSRQPGIDLTVFYCSRLGLDNSYDPQFGVSYKWDIPLLEGYRSVFLPSLGGEAGVDGFFRLTNPGIVRHLWKGRFDAILVHGYEHCTKWLAFAGARLARTRIVLRGESQLLSERPLHVRAVKRVVLGSLFRSISAFAYIGEANRKYYRHYGVPEARMTFAPYAVDNEIFSERDRSLRPHREALRSGFGITGDTPVVLACGKLIEKKQPLLLLRAFHRLRRERPCALVYAGDGALRPEIERVVREDGIPDVTITGFLNQGEIGRAYAAADILALPSRLEPWGLVVNEAMNFGLPLVVSDRVGCAADLVRPGENGFVVQAGREEPLVEALRTLASNPELRRAYGRRSREIVAQYSLDSCAGAIASAIRGGAQTPSGRGSGRDEPSWVASHAMPSAVPGLPEKARTLPGW